MTKQKKDIRDDLIDEYNNRRRWIGNDFDGNESLKKAFPRYAEKSWSTEILKRKIRDIQFFGRK